MSTGHSAPNPVKGRIAATMGKARILMEAMPYIQEFKGKTVVIKYGGSAMTDEALRDTFAGDVTLLSLVGIRPVIVHGGGPHISRAMGQAGVEPEWVEGLRVTDATTIRVVQTVLAGEINPDIVRLLSGHGAMAAGVTGIDGGLFVASPKDERLGFVGEIDRVDPSLVLGMLDRGIVPVVAPLARGVDGHVYNLNADTAAGALAEALGATKLVYLTDIEGLYRDLGDEDSLMPRVGVTDLEDMIATGRASAGMVPKLRSCISAMHAGVRQAHILDGRVQHALLLEIFTPEGIGTMVEPR
ncbi:MAG: acetylglutamate kinase [Acidimicrobiia bacterium]|nr:acetylglutamate kinase [Acidimicrobiia bacterium]